MTGPSARDLVALVGRTGQVSHAGLTVHVRILDVQAAYGRLRYCVTPLAGSGELWTERVVLDTLDVVA